MIERDALYREIWGSYNPRPIEGFTIKVPDYDDDVMVRARNDKKVADYRPETIHGALLVRREADKKCSILKIHWLVLVPIGASLIEDHAKLAVAAHVHIALDDAIEKAIFNDEFSPFLSPPNPEGEHAAVEKE